MGCSEAGLGRGLLRRERHDFAREVQSAHDLLEEGGSPAAGLEQTPGSLGPTDRQRDAREPCARAHVHAGPWGKAVDQGQSPQRVQHVALVEALEVERRDEIEAVRPALNESLEREQLGLGLVRDARRQT